MNWYKIGISVHSLADRTLLNQQIRALKDIAGTLSYLSKYVYQNAPHAKQAVYAIALDKKISSFPDIKELLLEAHRVALDSYKKFAEFCQVVVGKLTNHVKLMEVQRKEFTDDLAT